MRILSILLFVFLMMMAFFNPAAAKQGGGGAPNAKSEDYQRHIFRKRDAAAENVDVE